MGCDIHIVLERRELPCGDWIGLYSSDVYQIVGKNLRVKNRDYSFFAEIAGVRGSPGPEGYYAKNLPKDVSALAWHEYMKAPADHHSASHCSADVFCGCWLRMHPNNPGIRTEYALEELLGIYPDEGDFEYRVVFWFDN